MRAIVIHLLIRRSHCPFLSRSYASYPKEVRDTFCFKSLHLGHIAKSYALRDPPTKITGLGKGHWVKNDDRKREKSEAKSELKQEESIIKAQKRRINQRSLIVSEFSSGFDGIDMSAMAKPVGKGKKPKQKGKFAKGKQRTKA